MDTDDFDATARSLRARAKPGLKPMDLDVQRAHLSRRLTLISNRPAVARADLDPVVRFTRLRSLAKARTPRG